MKIISLATLALGAVVIMPAWSQAPSEANELKVRVMSNDVRRGAPSDILVRQIDPTQITFRENAQTAEIRTLPRSRFTTFYIFEPADFDKANQAYSDSKYKEARTLYSNLRKKYASTLAIPNSLASKAAYHEFMSAVRLRDWSGAKQLADQYPVKASELTPEVVNDLAVAQLLGLIPAKQWDKILTDAKALKATKKNMNLAQLSRVFYAEGLANAQKSNDYQAIQDLAVATAISHGATPEIASEALTQMMETYMKSPEVKQFIEATPGTPSAAVLARRPYSVRQAAGIYHLYQTLFPKQPLAEKFAVLGKYYSNPQIQSAPAAPAAPAAK